MLKKQTVVYQTLIFISLSYILGGCFFDKNHEKTNETPVCVQQHNCLTITLPNAILTFDKSRLVTEELINLEITSDKVISKVWLEGVNMNMGTLTLALDKKASGNYSSQLFFGMCAEPRMTWELYLLFEDGQLNSTSVESYWPKQ